MGGALFMTYPQPAIGCRRLKAVTGGACPHLEVAIGEYSKHIVRTRQRQLPGPGRPRGQVLSPIPRQHLGCWDRRGPGWFVDLPDVAGRAVLDEPQQDLVADPALADDVVVEALDDPSPTPVTPSSRPATNPHTSRSNPPQPTQSQRL